MKEITLYTTHCPKCKILQKKLSDKNVTFKSIENVQEIQKVTTKVPVLVIKDQNENKTLDYYEAIKYVNQL